MTSVSPQERGACDGWHGEIRTPMTFLTGRRPAVERRAIAVGESIYFGSGDGIRTRAWPAYEAGALPNLATPQCRPDTVPPGVPPGGVEPPSVRLKGGDPAIGLERRGAPRIRTEITQGLDLMALPVGLERRESG